MLFLDVVSRELDFLDDLLVKPAGLEPDTLQILDLRYPFLHQVLEFPQLSPGELFQNPTQVGVHGYKKYLELGPVH